jgi:hypothetical protein
VDAGVDHTGVADRVIAGDVETSRSQIVVDLAGKP